MRLLFILTSLVLFGSCSQTSKEEIKVPTLTAGFYKDALNQINDKLSSDPSNDNLVEQKLFYCEQLGWPTTCISALDQYKSKHGMTTLLADQYIAYYEQNERYSLLLELLERWNQEFDLNERFQRSLIKSLVATGKTARAKRELEVFLLRNTMNEDIAFAAMQYLFINDDLLAAYTLSRLWKRDPSHELMFDYGILLIEMGFLNDGYSVLIQYVLDADPTFEKRLEIARIFSRNDWLFDARQIIKPFIDRDTIAYLIADWYQRELLWDSAIMYIDTVLARDSLNSKGWWKKARMYEDRTWLSYSLQYFQKVLEITPKDTITIQRMDEIQRKIAYLQRRKFEESKVPILDLKPIKIQN